MNSNYKVSDATLRQRQSLPLEAKVAMTKTRIQSFVEHYGLDGVYVSFSGGKDSTVLLHIARQLYPEIRVLYLDTWMEYPSVREFVKTFDNVDIRKPEQGMKDIIKNHGWCFPGKDVAEAIEAYRNGKQWAIYKLNGYDGNGNYSEYRQQYKKWLPLVDAPFKFSNQCCMIMKEKPAAKYEKETGRKPILALMAAESARRKESYMRTGCNSFDGSREMSKPMGFWTEQDVLHYIIENDIKIAKPYGAIHEEKMLPGQLCLFSSCERKLCCSGEKRTGCIFCPAGSHLDNFKKFENLKKDYPELYHYCMEELGERELLEYLKDMLNKK